MCGLAGMVHRNGAPASAVVAQRMGEAVRATVEGLEGRQYLTVNPAAVQGDAFGYGHGTVPRSGLVLHARTDARADRVSLGIA